MHDNHRTIHADRQSLAVGGDMTVTIHACDLRQQLGEALAGEEALSERTGEIVLQCLSRWAAGA